MIVWCCESTYSKVALTIHPIRPLILSVKAQEAFVKTELGLAPKIVVHTGKYYYKIIACISSLTNETGIITGFSRLNLANDQTFFWITISF